MTLITWHILKITDGLGQINFSYPTKYHKQSYTLIDKVYVE